MGARKEPKKIEDPCIVCGLESQVGCVGLTNGEVVHEHYCNKCYNNQKYERRREGVKKAKRTKAKKKKQQTAKRVG